MSKESMSAVPLNDNAYSLGDEVKNIQPEKEYVLDDAPEVSAEEGEVETDLKVGELKQIDRNDSPEVQRLVAGSAEIRKILGSKMNPEQKAKAFQEAYARLLVAKRRELGEVGVDVSDLLESPEGLSQLRREEGERMVKESAKKVADAVGGVMGGIYEGVSYIPDLIKGGMNLARKGAEFAKKVFTLDNGYKAVGGAAAVGLTVSFPMVVLPVMGMGAAAVYGQQYVSKLLETRRDPEKDADSVLPGVNRAVEATNHLIDGVKKWGAGLFRRLGQAAEKYGNDMDRGHLDVRRAYDRSGEELLESHVHEGKASSEALADLKNELRLRDELDAVDPRLMTQENRDAFAEEVGAMREERVQEKLRDLEQFEAKEDQAEEEALNKLGVDVALAEDLMLEIREKLAASEDVSQLMEDFEELTGEAYSDDFNPDAWMMREMAEVVDGDPSTEDIAAVVAARMEKAGEEGYPRLQKKYATQKPESVATSQVDNDAPEIEIVQEPEADDQSQAQAA